MNHLIDNSWCLQFDYIVVLCNSWIVKSDLRCNGFPMYLFSKHAWLPPNVHELHVCFPFCTHLGTEEAATFLTNQLINTLSPVTSGNITIKTESWNSRDGVTNTTQKSQSWGGSNTFSFVLTQRCTVWFGSGFCWLDPVFVLCLDWNLHH